MNFELLSLLTLIISFLGIAIILGRKIPVLIKLPIKNESSKEGVVFALKERVGNISFLKTFSFEAFLQKFLSKIRVLTLKIEHKIAAYLQSMREKSQQKKSKENDDYWERLKKLTRKK